MGEVSFRAKRIRKVGWPKQKAWDIPSGWLCFVGKDGALSGLGI